MIECFYDWRVNDQMIVLLNSDWLHDRIVNDRIIVWLNSEWSNHYMIE